MKGQTISVFVHAQVIKWQNSVYIVVEWPLRNLVKTNGHEKWNASFRINSNPICTSAFLPKRHNALLPCSATFLQCRLAQTSMTSWQTDSNFALAFHIVDFWYFSLISTLFWLLLSVLVCQLNSNFFSQGDECCFSTRNSVIICLFLKEILKNYLGT